jgi:hypothetical protein
VSTEKNNIFYSIEEKNFFFLMTDCSTYPLYRRCFYIQTCSIDNATGQNCCTTECCVQGSILAVLSFVGVDVKTNTYYTQYYFVSATQPPDPINGVGSRVINNQYESVFNDGAKFTIRFVNNSLNIGRISIVTPAIAGEFCILDTALYNDFYSSRSTKRGSASVIENENAEKKKKSRKNKTKITEEGVHQAVPWGVL